VGQPDKLEPVYGTILTKNGYLGGSITYSDSLKPWLKFLPDVDGLTGFDWIKAGVAGTDWSKPLPYDPEGVFENVLPLRFPDFGITGGTWTPYMFTESGKTDTIVGIAHAESQTLATSRDNNLFYDIASVDVVFTPDRTKWTRCVVIEMSPQNGSIDVEGGAKQFEIRKHRSVNQDGDTAVISSDPAKNSDLISPYGMGWFPGYAINVETGERLNIMFGEDSRLIADNGRDMLFNPTSRYIDNTGRPVVGGKHAIYIMGHVEGKKARVGNKSILPPECFDNPAYDGGANFYKQVNVPRISSFMQQVRAFQFSNCMWAAIPMANSENAWLNNDVKISLRITKPYQRYFSSPISGVQNVNNYWPAYTFETKDVATNLNDVAKATSDLDLINVVPNPYRAYDSYEVSQLDNRVKIVNLPQRCQVTIYSVNGNIIRKFNKDEAKTSIDWDLKNFAGIPIAGGVYLIHVKTDQGEKVVKWFGSLRPVDLNAF
jgi:hypothetical protein